MGEGMGTTRDSLSTKVHPLRFRVKGLRKSTSLTIVSRSCLRMRTVNPRMLQKHSCVPKSQFMWVIPKIRVPFWYPQI